LGDRFIPLRQEETWGRNFFVKEVGSKRNEEMKKFLFHGKSTKNCKILKFG
jgi:hypothetical protein